MLLDVLVAWATLLGMKTPRWLLIVICLLVVIVAAIDFARETQARAATTETGEAVVIQIGGEPSTLDPARVVDQYGFGILRNVVEGPFKLDSDGKLEKGLMATHSVSTDGLKHEMTLRTNAKWSDGKAVTLQDCLFGLRRALDPKTASPNADSFFAIANARDVFEGRKPVETLGVSIEGDRLVIRLAKPDPSLPLVLTLPAAAPAREELFTANKGNWSPSFPVTGRYRIERYSPADRIELTPNPNHPRPAKTKVIYRILTEEITAMNLFEAGRLDVVSTVTATEIDRLRAKDSIRTFPSTTVFSLSFNVSRPPFDDLVWRRALASSVDREGLSKALRGVFEPTTSYLPKTLAGTLPYAPLKDEAAIAKIKALPKKPRLRLAFGNSAFTRTVAEKVQSDFKRVLGLSVELEPMELKTLLARLKSDPPDIYFLGMSAIYDDPMNQLMSFSTLGGPNFSRYTSGAFDRTLEKIRESAFGPKRAELAREANRTLTEKDVVVVPVVLRMQVFGVSKTLKGFKVNPYQVIDLGELGK